MFHVTKIMNEIFARIISEDLQKIDALRCEVQKHEHFAGKAMSYNSDSLNLKYLLKK